MSERMTNKERETLIAGDRLGALEPEEAAEVHLLASLLADPATWAEPSAGLEDAIVDAITNDQPRAATVTDIDDRRRRTRRRTRVIIPSAAAAVAATIAIVLGSAAASSGPGPAFTAALAPTAIAPRANGSADVVRNNGGFRVHLDATGLDPLPDGRYYEAWLKDEGGTQVPIGTFSSSDEHITLWSGVSPATFTTISITIESPDNVQASSGQIVLVGRVRDANG